MKNNKDQKILVVKKSELNVMENYDVLSIQDVFFLPCKVVLEEETMQFIYNTQHKKQVNELRKEDKLMQILILTKVALLETKREQYEFSLSPDNLYYDLYGNIYVMHKDVVPRNYSGKQPHFLEEYKSLIGYICQKRYSYADYLEGGQALLGKNEFLRRVMQAKDVEGIRTCLECRYDEILEDKLHNSVEVKRSVYKRKKIYTFIATLALVLSVAALGYMYFYKVNQLEDIVAVYGDYLVQDYVSLIDDGQSLNAGNLNSRQKYVLAVAYVKSENLTAEQKNNILALMMPEGEEQVLEYWIALGRGELSKAENIAMQRSNDELLLYAYLKEKQSLETDTEIDGVQKSEAISVLQGKIDTLSEKYTTEEGNDE